MTLSRLFVLHALATFAAGVVLVVAPEAIPSTVGIDLPARARLLAYLLAGAELGLAALSFQARRVTDATALRALVMGFVVLHGSTALFELLALREGVSLKLALNVAARLLIGAAFLFALKRETARTP